MNYILTLILGLTVGIANAEIAKDTPPPDGLNCFGISEPMIITGNGGPSCSSQKICYMRVRCTEYSEGRVVNNHGDTDAVCTSL